MIRHELIGLPEIGAGGRGLEAHVAARDAAASARRRAPSAARARRRRVRRRTRSPSEGHVCTLGTGRRPSSARSPQGPGARAPRRRGASREFVLSAPSVCPPAPELPRCETKLRGPPVRKRTGCRSRAERDDPELDALIAERVEGLRDARHSSARCRGRSRAGSSPRIAGADECLRASSSPSEICVPPEKLLDHGLGGSDQSRPWRCRRLEETQQRL